MRTCTKCGKNIDELNYSMVNSIVFCSDDCNIKHHNWDKIPSEIQALKELSE